MDTAPGTRCDRLPRRVLIALVGLAWSAQGTAATADGPGPASTVADAPPAESVADRSPPLSREQAYTEFKRLLEAGEHAAAVQQARLVVELAEHAQPPDAEELQVALMNLGVAERLAGDFVAAEATYQRVIDLIEASGRLASPRLARAQAGLALTYYAARRYDLAVPGFERAIALNRRAEGLFNEDQLPLLEKQADALTEVGRSEEALQAHRYALRLVERRAGSQSLRYAKELESLGRWYTRARAYESSRMTLRRAADLVATLEGPESLQLIGPLTAFAENARRWLLDPQSRPGQSVDEERRAMYHDPVMPGPLELSAATVQTEGLRALERAAAIVDASPDAPPASIAAVRVQLGDLNQIRQAPDKAVQHYQQAWQAAAQATQDGRPLRQVLFGDPVLLYYAAPSGWDRHAGRPPEEAERRNVVLELTVTADGRVRDPHVLTDAGDPRLGVRAQRATESARYRPRFEDGQPVAAPGVRFVQPFYVLVKEAPSGATPPGEPAQPRQGVEPPPPPGTGQGGG